MYVLLTVSYSHETSTLQLHIEPTEQYLAHNNRINEVRKGIKRGPNTPLKVIGDFSHVNEDKRLIQFVAKLYVVKSY